MKIKSIKQRDASACGPTCIEMALKYFSIPHTVKQIAETSKYKKAGGIYNRELVKILQLFGLKTKISKNTDWESLMQLNTPNTVIIVSWMLDGYIGHFGVVEKVNKTHVFLAEPTTGKIKKVEKFKFLRLWLDYEAGNDTVWYPETKSNIQLRWMVAVKQ